MEQRISIITLGVENLQKARAFYDRLGWKVASEEDADKIVCYDLNGLGFALYPWEKLAEDMGLAAHATEPAKVTLAYNVHTKGEVNEMLKEAEQAGAKIIKQAQDVFWGGYSGYFEDPDGHRWEVAYNPFSPLGKQNEFQW